MQVPSHVEYERASSVEHARALLGRPDHGVRAGGHSLIPMMKLRLAQPGVLVDINGLAELAYIKEHGGHLCIGALARHADLLDSDIAGQHFPIFHDAERVVADPTVLLVGTLRRARGHRPAPLDASAGGLRPRRAAPRRIPGT